MTTDPRKAYRQQLIQTESKPDIFMHAYDRVVGLLHSAAAATEAHDIETKTRELNQALNVIVYLQGALDYDNGGEVASNLDRFYTLLRGEIFKGSARLDAGILRQAADRVAEVRKVWERAQSVNVGSAAVPTAPAQPSPLQSPVTSMNPSEQDPSSQTTQSSSWSA